MQDFLYPLTTLSQWGSCMEVVQLLGSWEPCQGWLCRSTGIYCHKRNHAIKAFSSLWPMAPHFSTLAWKIPWMEEPGRLQSMGLLESDTTKRLHFHFSISCIGEGNGNPLQCSCLENPRDGGAWWAAVYGVEQSRTRLMRLSSSSSSSSQFVLNVTCN